MLPGPDLKISCPHCSHEALARSYLSGNTLGACLWSDGFLNAPMMGERSPILQCDACQALSWSSDWKMVGELNSWGQATPEPLSYEERASLSYARPPQRLELELVKASSLWVLTLRRKDALRLLLWDINDTERHRALTEEECEQKKEKLNELLNELDLITPWLISSSRITPEDYLMRAELLRSLERYDEALEELKLVTDEELTEIVNTLTKACEERDPTLKVLRGSSRHS